MGNKARDYKRSTLRKLDTLSGNQCAEPDCEKSLLAKDENTLISKICHIEAANEGGARYNPQMTDDERRHYNNLILLCDECHQIIDNKENEAIYPVTLLQKWKANHASKQMNKCTSKQSLLIQAIDAIASINFDENESDHLSNVGSFDISDKISHNAIKRNSSLIEEYKVYHGRISSLYQELEKGGSFKKERLLRNIQACYLKVKGKYLDSSKNEMESIRINADNIIEDVEDQLFEIISNNNGLLQEDFTFEVSVIMVDAFMRCKILENP